MNRPKSPPTWAICPLLAGLLFGASSQLVSAKDTTAAALPGVDARVGDKVVAIRPSRPLDGEIAETDSDGWVKVGSWKMKVSGSVRVDIGVGHVRPDDR